MSRIQGKTASPQLATEQVYVGIDVSKSRLDVFLHPIGLSRSVTNDEPGLQQLARLLRKHGPELIVLEATGSYHRRAHRHLHDADEARIQKMIASDPDAPEVTDAQMAEAKPFTDAFPALAEKMRKNVGGRHRSANPKVPVSIRLDQELVAKLKATGPGWQSRVNEMLRRQVLTDR